MAPGTDARPWPGEREGPFGDRKGRNPGRAAVLADREIGGYSTLPAGKSTMGYVHCPFCGARVTMLADGSVQPKCPRCGAWAVAGGAGGVELGDPPTGATGNMEATMALESRAVAAPNGDVTFVRTPYAGEVPADLNLEG